MAGHCQRSCTHKKVRLWALVLAECCMPGSNRGAALDAAHLPAAKAQQVQQRLEEPHASAAPPLVLPHADVNSLAHGRPLGAGAAAARGAPSSGDRWLRGSLAPLGSIRSTTAAELCTGKIGEMKSSLSAFVSGCPLYLSR